MMNTRIHIPVALAADWLKRNGFPAVSRQAVNQAVDSGKLPKAGTMNFLGNDYRYVRKTDLKKYGQSISPVRVAALKAANRPKK